MDSLVAINFYDNRGDSTKKRAIGKVLMGNDTIPPSNYCKVEITYPVSCKGTLIGVLLQDLKYLGHEVTSSEGTIPWEEIVLRLARELDQQQKEEVKLGT